MKIRGGGEWKGPPITNIQQPRITVEAKDDYITTALYDGDQKIVEFATRMTAILETPLP